MSNRELANIHPAPLPRHTHTHTLTIELPPVDMRPPWSVTYPVQASRQLHDAKQVPVRSGRSPINEYRAGSLHVPPEAGPPPWASVVPGAPSSQPTRLSETYTHHRLLQRLQRRSACFPSPALSFMHESVEPNSRVLRETEAEVSQASSPRLSAY